MDAARSVIRHGRAAPGRAAALLVGTPRFSLLSQSDLAGAGRVAETATLDGNLLFS
jgi:hypothetical protein